MIARVWHGWTAPADADAYERLLREEVLPDMAGQAGDGFRGAEVLRRADGEEVAFITILRFVSMDAVRRVVGDDVRAAHVPADARALLTRYDETVTHYDVALDVGGDRIVPVD
ncbi:MAG: antibiotic biosynthesis monooxygenase family protein [Salinivenus sp.]